MNPRTVRIVHSSEDEWTVDGQLIAVPEGEPAQAFVLAHAGATHPPGTPATLSTVEGGARRITLVTLSPQVADTAPDPARPPADAASPLASATAPFAPAAAVREPKVLHAGRSIDRPAAGPRGRRALLWGLTAVLAVAASVLAVVLVLPRFGGAATATEEEPVTWGKEWAVTPPGGALTSTSVQIAGAGMVLTVDGGEVAAYRQGDGGYIGSTSAPEGFRIGVGPDFAVVAASADGASSGSVITPGGIAPFDQQPGVLIRRGTVPFLAGGAGSDQFALLHRGDRWEKVSTPAPGLAPLAATETGVAWLGTGRAITVTDHSGTVTSESVLRTPEGAIEATQRAFVTESLIGVVWTDAGGDRELVTHSLGTGEILGRSPVGMEVFDKSGEEITSTTSAEPSTTAASPSYWRLADDVPQRVTAQCPDPVPSGGTTWCAAGNIFTDSSGATLPAGIRPIPSNTDTVPVIDGDRLALYRR